MSEKPSSRKRHILAAWLVGCVAYVVLAADIIADAGMITMPFQLVFSAIFSIAVVGVACLLGLLFRIRSVSKI